MVKCIATDLDRTLLRKDKSISSFTADVFSRCRAQNIKLVFATARPLRSIRQYQAIANPDALIVHNGAVIYEGGDRPIFHCGISPAITQKIIADLLRAMPGCQIAAELNDVMYCNFDPTVYWSNTEYQPSDFTALPNIPAEKLIVGTNRADIIAPLLPDHCYVQIGEGKVALILPRAATKWNALQHLANHWDISPAAIAAFGDDLNDLEMLQNCGIGVAVANALDEVKAIVDDVCSCNEDDGAARWIANHILKESR